jgi:hypothetical protein
MTVSHTIYMRGWRDLHRDEINRRRRAGRHAANEAAGRSSRAPRPRTLESVLRETASDGDCLMWTGPTVRGYGYAWVGSSRTLIHRLVYELARGPIPKGMEVCHHCDRPACVEPTHLFLGTHADNMADTRAKGRQSRGPEHGEATRRGKWLDRPVMT